MDADSAQLHRLNRMYRLLSQINRAIVRAESPDGLYVEACRIAVESGLFDLAWIGLLDPLSDRLRAMARCGNASDIVDCVCGGDVLPETASASASAPAWLALREARHVVCNDLAVSPPTWPGRDEALACGLTAMASFPLREAGQVVGLLELYSGQPDQFDPDVVHLIEEVTEDISFALEHLLQEQHRLVAETKVRYLAYYDSQTGLPSRVLLEQRLQHLAAVSGQEPLALLDIKLQRLEPLVRVLGHTAVDKMLRTLAQRLERLQGSAGLVAQLAQDEFAIAMPGLADREAIKAFTRDVLHTLTQPLVAGNGKAFLGAGIGVAIYPWDETQVPQLLPRARAATASLTFDGEVRFYSPELDRDSASRLALESELHQALERGEFELHYQPQLSLKTGAMVGVEALLRWRHPSKGLVGPGLFIPVLEGCGLMARVGEWVLRTACAQNQVWQDSGLAPLRMAVNLSAQQFRQSELVGVVRSALRDSGMAAEWLELELTESLILEDAERTIQMMHELKQLGVTLSLDDFGTGYSSLSYLRRFPIDRIKIDQSFVRDIATQAGAAAIARTILAMADNLGLATIAEGVEDTSQLGYLRKHACQEMQGFLFSRALPPGELATWLHEDRKLLLANGATMASPTVLAVDEEPSILAALKRLLRRDGITVLTAGSAREGLEVLATAEVGVVLSDQCMPDVSGTEFLDQVKDLYPDMIRILLTGYTDVSAVIDAINCGGLYKVLTKPWDDDHLREHIREALRHYETTLENSRLQQRLEQFRAKYPGADC